MHPQRSKYIPPSKVEKWFKKHHSSAMSQVIKGNFIYRGLRRSNSKFLYVRPSQVERQSKNTKNIYTALMDILPSWQGWPRRSRSVICSDSSEYASGYLGEREKNTYSTSKLGALYIVLPKNGSKIGVCPDQDIWDSFVNIQERWNADNMHMFNQSFDDILQRAYDLVIGDRYNKEIGELNGEGMDFFLNHIEGIISKNTLKKLMNDYDYGRNAEIGDMLEYKFGKNISWIEYFDDLMNPDKNNFKLQPIESYNPREVDSTRDMHEVWTESDCLFVRMSNFNANYTRRINNDYFNIDDLITKVTGKEYHIGKDDDI